MRIPIAAPQIAPEAQSQPAVPTAGTAAMNRGNADLARGLDNAAAFLEASEAARGETWAAKKLAEARAEWTKSMIERENAAEGEATGYADQFTADFAVYSERTLALAPNAHARDRLERGLIEMGGRLGAGALTFEATRRVAHRGEMVAATIAEEANSVLSDPGLYGDAVANVMALIDNAGLPADVRAKLKADAASTLAEANVHAMLREDPLGAMKALNEGRWDKELSPDAKNRLINAARPAAGRAIGASLWDAHSNANLSKAIATGDSGKIAAAVMPAVIWQESRGRTGLTSPKGAMGIGQMMPGTAKAAAARLGVEYDPDKLLNDPEYGAKLATEEMRHLLERYDNNLVLALAAYNAGPGNVDKWLASKGDPRTGALSDMDWAAAIPFKETREYILGVPGDPKRPGVLGKMSESGALTEASGIADPVMRGAAEAEIASKESEASASREAFLAGFKDELAYLQAGNSDAPDSKFTEAALIDVFGPIRGRELFDLKAQAIMEGQVYKSIRLASPEDMARMRERLVAETGDPAGYEDAAARLATFDKLAAKRAEALQTDPAGYVLSVDEVARDLAGKIDEDPQRFARRMLLTQERLGVTVPRITTKAMADQIVADLNTTDSALVGAKIEGLDAAWGEFFPDVLRELRGSGLSGPMFVAAAYADQPGLSQQIVAAARAGKAELEKGVDPATARDMTTAIDGALQPYREAFAAGAVTGEAVKQFNEVRDAMMLWGLAQLQNGNASAADDAVRRFMETKFLDPIRSGNVHALVPVMFDGKPMSEGRVLTATRALSTREALEKFKPVAIGADRLPPSMAGVAGDLTLNAIVSSGLWVSNDTSDGLMMVVPDESGVPIPVLNEAGEPYEVLYSDMLNVKEMGSVELTGRALNLVLEQLGF